MPEPLQDRFDVVIGRTEKDPGQTYTFRIPTIKYDIEVGYKAAEIRAKAYPEANGAMGGLDWQAVSFSRYCAIMELYLVKSTTLWPYGFSDDDMSKVDLTAPPKVEFDKFPVGAAEDVFAVGQAFETEIARFRRRRHSNQQSAGA